MVHRAFLGVALGLLKGFLRNPRIPSHTDFSRALLLVTVWHKHMVSEQMNMNMNLPGQLEASICVDRCSPVAPCLAAALVARGGP